MCHDNSITTIPPKHQLLLCYTKQHNRYRYHHNTSTEPPSGTSKHFYATWFICTKKISRHNTVQHFFFENAIRIHALNRSWLVTKRQNVTADVSIVNSGWTNEMRVSTILTCTARRRSTLTESELHQPQQVDSSGGPTCYVLKMIHHR